MTRREALIQARAHSRIEGLTEVYSQPLEDWANGLIDGAEAERRIIAKYKVDPLGKTPPVRCGDSFKSFMSNSSKNDMALTILDALARGAKIKEELVEEAGGS